jgi:hypothetical protein
MNLKTILLVTTLLGCSAKAKGSKHYKKVPKRVEPISSATALVDKDIVKKIKERRKRYLLSYKKLPPLK